jgi:hypothetical protein
VDDSGALTRPANIGTLVVVPNGGRSESFAVQIVTAIDTNMSPADCLQMKMQGQKLSNCIFASREIAFIPHTPITLPIEITLDCKDIDCTQGETCDHGVCRSDVTHATGCQGGGCNAVLTDASLDATSNPADASTEPSIRDAHVSDQPAMDGTMSDVMMDSSGNDVTLQDGPSEGPTQSAGGPPSDASPLGTCVSANSSGAGVECAGGRCNSSQVCCVSIPMFAPPTEACTSTPGCDVGSTGYPLHWGLACRNWGDCLPGTVCCYQATDAGAGLGIVSTCVPTASCQGGGATLPKIGCQNTCECGTLPGDGGTCNAKSCYGATYGICGGPAGSSCP